MPIDEKKLIKLHCDLLRQFHAQAQQMKSVRGRPELYFKTGILITLSTITVQLEEILQWQR